MLDKDDIATLKGLISLIKVNNGKFSDEDIKLLKGIYKIVNAYTEPERWITVKGNHIPIYKGETKKQAIERFLKDKGHYISEDGFIEEGAKALYKAYKDYKCESNEPAYKYPKTIAGVFKGKPMTFEQADSGRVNPYFNKDNYAYSHNCQSCVVTYEARIRGYNVQVVPREHNGKTAQLAQNSAWAWLDPVTGKKCEYKQIKVNSGNECYEWLEKNIKKGERYQFVYYWKGTRNGKTHLFGHVVTLSRDNYGRLRYYDPQVNKILTGENIIPRLNKSIIYNNTFLKPKILRVDDKKFNPYFMNDIMRKL